MIDWATITVGARQVITSDVNGSGFRTPTAGLCLCSLSVTDTNQSYAGVNVQSDSGVGNYTLALIMNFTGASGSGRRHIATGFVPANSTLTKMTQLGGEVQYCYFYPFE